MRAIVAVLIALALVAGLPDDAGAQEQSGKQKTHAKKRHRNPEANPAGQQRGSDYIEYRAEKMPFGSSEWWAQMMREQRLGGETP